MDNSLRLTLNGEMDDDRDTFPQDRRFPYAKWPL